MTPEEKQPYFDAALEMHKKGFNCAQCVAVSVCEKLGLDPDQTFRITEAFGGGMGAFTQTCGAISGAVALIGQANSNGIEACNSKKVTYQWAKVLVEGFEHEHGSTLCSALRPEEPELRMPACNGYIVDCVDRVLDLLEGIEASQQA